MANVKAAAGRIREHIQAVIFFFFSIVYVDGILFPVFPPFFLNGGMVVLCHDDFLHFLWYGSPVYMPRRERNFPVKQKCPRSLSIHRDVGLDSHAVPLYFVKALGFHALISW